MFSAELPDDLLHFCQPATLPVFTCSLKRSCAFLSISGIRVRRFQSVCFVGLVASDQGQTRARHGFCVTEGSALSNSQKNRHSAIFLDAPRTVFPHPFSVRFLVELCLRLAVSCDAVLPGQLERAIGCLGCVTRCRLQFARRGARLVCILPVWLYSVGGLTC